MVRLVQSTRRRHASRCSVFECVLCHVGSRVLTDGLRKAFIAAKNEHVALLEKQWHTAIGARDVCVHWDCVDETLYCVVTVLIQHH